MPGTESRAGTSEGAWITHTRDLFLRVPKLWDYFLITTSNTILEAWEDKNTPWKNKRKLARISLDTKTPQEKLYNYKPINIC